MKICQIFMMWILLMGIGVPLLLPAYAESLSSPLSGRGSVLRVQERQSEDSFQVLQRLAQADVVYLGETHDRVGDHQTQLEIIRTLNQQRSQMAIAMEMFQRPFQPILDAYLSGQISEAELRDRSQYTTRWGYPWEFYAPILRFAKEKHLSVIALNTPTEVTRKVARSGLASLRMSERQWIPPQSAIVLEPATYRQRMRQIYDEIHQGKSNSAGFDRFFLAQVLWDETMAEQIAKRVRQRPVDLVVVLVGQGHIAYGDGIPSRVARRLAPIRNRPLDQVLVWLNPDSEDAQRSTPAIADYFWYAP